MARTSVLEEVFSQGRTPQERGDMLEETKEALRKSIERHDKGLDAVVGTPIAHGGKGSLMIKGAGQGAVARQNRIEKSAERFYEVAKSMTPEQRSEVEAVFADMREMQADYNDLVGKDITSTSPGNLHPYDLEGLKFVVPYFYMLGNDIPRTRGQGTAREYRRILGFTNTGMGGVSDQSIFFNSETDTGAPTFGSLTLRRPQKIQYATDSHVVPYVEAGVSDEVTDKAYFTDLGFENVDELSLMAMLWAHKLGEEKADLYARGSAQGFTGAVSAPVISIASSATGGQVAAGTYFVKVTARAGYGESVVSNEVNTGALTGATNQFTVTVGTEPVGALGYNLYAGTATGAEKFITSFTSNTITVTTTPSGSIAPPSADSTASQLAYDGFLTVLTDPSQSGYVNKLNAPLFVQGGSNNLGDKPFQDMFASLWASVYGEIDELWVTAPIARELYDFVRAQNGGAAGYRIILQEGAQDGIVLGGAVSGILNESSPSHKIADLRIHPYMPAGCSFGRQRRLNIPNSGIADTSAVVEVQGYMAVEWARIQFMRERSTYWLGVLLHYASKWNGAIVGIQ